MKEKIIARRYAEAFLGFAKETGSFQAAVDDLGILRGILRDNPELKNFLSNKEILYSEKCAFLDKIFKDLLTEQTRQFLKLLLEKFRIECIEEIADYVRKKYSHGEAVDMLLETAFILDIEVIQKIKDKLEEKLQKKLNLYLRLDSDLLGGVRATIGNFVIDGSVRNRLQDLRENLMRVAI